MASSSSFQLELSGKIPRISLVMNERITSNKIWWFLHKGQHFLSSNYIEVHPYYSSARSTVSLFPARITRRAGAPSSANLSFFQDFSKFSKFQSKMPTFENQRSLYFFHGVILLLFSKLHINLQYCLKPTCNLPRTIVDDNLCVNLVSAGDS